MQHEQELSLFKRAVNQQKDDKNKIYSLHKLYESGNKVGILHEVWANDNYVNLLVINLKISYIRKVMQYDK